MTELQLDRLLATLAEQAQEIAHQESVIRALRAQNEELLRPAVQLSALDVLLVEEQPESIQALTRKLRLVG